MLLDWQTWAALLAVAWAAGSIWRRARRTFSKGSSCSACGGCSSAEPLVDLKLKL